MMKSSRGMKDMRRFRLFCYLLLIVLSLSSVDISTVGGRIRLKNEGVVIGNLDDGRFLYACKRYYNFSARYRDIRGAASLQLVGIAFSDGLHWVNATLDLKSGDWLLASGGEVASMNASLCSYRIRGDILKVDFFIMLDWNISDYSGVDIYQLCSDSIESTGWVLTTPNCADIVSTLIVEDLKISDDRGNTGQEIEVSGRVFYMGGLSPPNDEEIKGISIVNSKGVYVADTDIMDGYFRAIFNATEMIGEKSYRVLIIRKGIYEHNILNRYVLEFDGIDDFLKISDPRMEMREGITIELWFNPIVDQYQPLIQSGGWNGYYLRQNPGGGIYFLIRDDENIIIFDEMKAYWYKDKNWTHVAVVVEFGIDCKIFINGEMKASIPCNIESPRLEEYPVMIGYFDGDIVECFQGLMDEIRIYLRPLTSGEIRYSFLNGRPLNRSGLALWLSLDEGGGLYANDLSGRGNRVELGGLDVSRAPMWVVDDPLRRTSVSFIADELEVHLKALSNRIDISRRGVIKSYAIRRFDGTIYDGILELNDTIFTSDVVMKRGYTVRRAYGGRYGITKIGLNDEVYIIWDRIIISDGGASTSVARIGDEVTLWVKAEYEYDGRPFTGLQGRIWINGTAMKWSKERDRWELNITSLSPGRRVFKVSSIHDSVYNITSYTDKVGVITIDFKSTFITTKMGIMMISMIIIILTVVIPMMVLRFYESSLE